MFISGGEHDDDEIISSSNHKKGNSNIIMTNNNNNNNNNNGISISISSANKRNVAGGSSGVTCRNRTSRTTIVLMICCTVIGFLLGSSFQSIACYKYWTAAAAATAASTSFVKYDECDECDEYVVASNNMPDETTTTAAAAAADDEVVVPTTQVKNEVKEWNHYPILKPDNIYNPNWLVVSHSRKLAITIIPKAMCSTIRNAFNNKLEHCGQSVSSLPAEEEPHHRTAAAAGDDDDDDGANIIIAGYNNNTFPTKILKKIPSYKQKSLTEKKHYMMKTFPLKQKYFLERCTEARRNPELSYNHSMYLEEENYTTVLLVRDPFERAYSAYRNSDKNQYIYLDDNVCQNTKQCTFEMWVNRLIDYKKSKDKSIKYNEHFMTQTQIAQFNEIRYHYKLRMTSNKDLAYFFKNLMGLKNGVPNEHANSSSGRRRSLRRRRQLRQLKNNDSNNKTTTNNNNGTVTNNNSNLYYADDYNKVLTLFESIPPKTMNQLAILYKDDLKLWQELLDYGTPRSPGEEITLYDYYISDQNILQKITIGTVFTNKYK
jgi:hypothetical protein